MADQTAIAPYARTAYAQGWAASGGPMTRAVRAGCIAAVQMCIEHQDEPGILEVALHLGHLEGVWAQVFHRRLDLIEQYGDILTPLWQEAAADLDVAGAIEELRREAGLSESRESRRQIKALARALAMRLMSWLTGKTIWQRLRDAMRAVLTAAHAEGYASALAVAASEQKLLGFEFDIAFKHAYEALANLGELWADADTWLTKVIGRAADDFGRELANLVESEASYEDMVSAGMSILGMQSSDAVSFVVDWALSTGLSQGALNLYRSEGVQKVTWMTAGDDHVCVTCERNGQDSPFEISEFPQMPAHPLCRCVAVAELLDLSDYSAFFSS